MNEDTMKDLVRRIADPDKVSPFSNGFVTLTDEEMVKFAELIVRECAKVSERTGALNEADFEGEMIAGAIKEHFGVEE